MTVKVITASTRAETCHIVRARGLTRRLGSRSATVGWAMARAYGPVRRTLGRVRPISMALVPLLLAGGFVAPAVSAPADPPRCGGQVATIVGTPGRDHLWGTPGP